MLDRKCNSAICISKTDEEATFEFQFACSLSTWKGVAKTKMLQMVSAIVILYRISLYLVGARKGPSYRALLFP